MAREDLAGLRELTERYPWFSGAHLLLALGEHAEGDVLFDERLRTTATHIPLRAVLFDRIGPIARPPSTPQLVEDAPDATTAAEVNTPTAPEPLPHAGPASPVPIEATPSSGKHDPLEQQYLEAALASTYELVQPYQAPSAPEPTPPGPQGEEITARPSPSGQPPDMPATPQEPMATDLVPGPGSPRIPGCGSRNGRPGRPADPPPGGTIPSAEPRTTHRSFFGSRALGSAARDDREGPDASVLIDRFITQQHPEPQRTTAFFDPQRAAKRSLEEHMDLVTETLARIYEQQGNSAKAIATYRQLALKYPAKSAYFAALVRKLEQRTNK